MPEKGVITEST